MRLCQWPSALRIDGNRTSKGSFLAILKDLHKTHLHPNLPFTVVSTKCGLGIRSRTGQFKRLSDALVGYGRLVPLQWVSQSVNGCAGDAETNAHIAERKIVAKLREFV